MYDSDHVVPPPQLETEYLTRIVINDNDFVQSFLSIRQTHDK